MDQREYTAFEHLERIRVEPIETGPVELSPEYLEAVARVERLPSNQDGVDKSWLWEALESDRQHFARAQSWTG